MQWHFRSRKYRRAQERLGLSAISLVAFEGLGRVFGFDAASLVAAEEARGFFGEG